MMTPEQATDRAADLVARARAAGADAADAVFSARDAFAVSVRLGALEDVDRSESVDLGLRVFCGCRSASASTSDLSADAVDALVERVVGMARAAPEDRWSGLAPAERLLHGAAPLLDIADRHDIDPAALKADALAAEDAARGVAGVTNSEGGSASAARSITALATSHGFAGAYASSRFGIGASVVAGEGAGKERDSAYHAARHRRLLDPADAIGTLAGERAVARLAPVRAPRGAMPVVFDPRIGAGLLGHLIGAIAGSAITRRTSFLLDRLGERVFAPGITIADDPHRPHGLGSRPFDGEGLPVSPTMIVADGMLETWLLDSAAARQLGLEPTGHAVRGGPGAPGVATANLHMAAGTQPPGTLIAGIARGVYVTELIGSGINATTGDYSRGASGFLIEDGQVTRPINEFTIAGNLKAMYRQLTPANDLVFRYATNVPTLLIEGMTVASG